MNNYVQANFYTALKAAGKPLRAVELGLLLGVWHRTAHCALWRLRANGWVKQTGWQKTARWSVTELPGEPGDMRGMAAGSARGRTGRKKGLNAMFAVRGLERRLIHPQPWKATAIEQAIGWGCER